MAAMPLHRFCWFCVCMLVCISFYAWLNCNTYMHSIHCYNKFVYIVGAVICDFYTIIYMVGALFYSLLEHFDIHCWNNYLYASTQFYTLLVHNSIHYWYTILYIVGAVVCTFLHNCVHCWNTILYICFHVLWFFISMLLEPTV